MLKAHPGHAKVWLSLGHALKIGGAHEGKRRRLRTGAGSRARPSARPTGAWPISRPTASPRIASPPCARSSTASDLGEEDRLHLEFALGKALEDARAYAASFGHYERGNRLRRAQLGYDAGDLTGLVARSRELLTPEFFAGRAGQGCEAATPIFVVGLPRSGSTLVEQILASHSAVEGTLELPEITAISRALGRARRGDEAAAYPGVLAQLDAEQARALGEGYLERTRIHRKSSRPFFIDKMPNNFAHVGLIHLILPNAKIIDARRHPMAAGFSAYKQHFAAGQHFTYDLEELGRYYRDYVELMAHFDEALPGRVHRVIYERLVEDTRGRGPPPARLLRPAVRGRLPQVLRKRPRGAHRQLRAGAPADLQGRGRALARLRAVARAAEGGAGGRPSHLPRGACARVLTNTHHPEGLNDDWDKACDPRPAAAGLQSRLC